MYRSKGTPNTPQVIIDEIIEKHKAGNSTRELSEEYGKPLKTIRNMITRENNKKRRLEAGVPPKQRGRKAVVTLQEYKYENLLNRQFTAQKPNQKWVTDISYIHTGQGVLYLSIIRDLYDNSIVAYKTGTTQATRLVLDTVKAARRKEKVTAELLLHSDQGFQYTSKAYFDLIQSYGITASMSRRGNCYDNALAENFFSILKTECIYRAKPTSFAEARALIDDYIWFYNYHRIQLKTGEAPMTQRHSR